MKAMNLGGVLAIGGLLILITITTAICCSALRGSENPAYGLGSGSSTIFEKGKTYVMLVSPPMAEVTLEVVEIGPQPWLKVKKPEKGGERWLNSNHIIMVEPK